MNARKVLKARGLFDIIDYIDGVYWLKQGTSIFKIYQSLNLNIFQKTTQRLLCLFGWHKFIYNGYDSRMCFLGEHEIRVLGGWCEGCNTAIQFKIRDLYIPFDPKELAKRAKALLWHRKFYGYDPTVIDGG